jgi:two-component system, chemotaxis family, chemotaxis protein CheY
MLKVRFTENSQLFAIGISIRREKRGGLAPLDRRTRFSGAGVPLPIMRRGVRERMMSVSMSMPILIVDDYNTMIRILRNLLRQLGFTNIDEACDGSTALAKLRAKEYALVISDSSMAPMSGMELLQRVRADERTRATPFVMVGDADDESLASRAGASSCLAKPFNAQTLKSKLVPVLGAF